MTLTFARICCTFASAWPEVSADAAGARHTRSAAADTTAPTRARRTRARPLTPRQVGGRGVRLKRLAGGSVVTPAPTGGTMRRRPTSLAALATVAIVALTGCGGGSGAGSTASKDPKAAFAAGLSGLSDTDALTMT